MVFLVPFVWTTAATISAAAVTTSLFMFTTMTPSLLRIPLYQLQPKRIFHPKFTWRRQAKPEPNRQTTMMTAVNGGLEFQATIRTFVQTEKIDNFILHADIYAATFDIFYPNWKGILSHIGNVRDLSLMQKEEKAEKEIQYLFAQQELETKGGRLNKTNNNIEKGRWNTTSPPLPPLWTIQPRQSLEIDDDLRLTLLPQLFHSLSTLTNLLWTFVKHQGKLTIPTTGVAHVRAGILPATTIGGSTAFTIGIICENVIDIFQTKLIGKECTLQGLSRGWNNLQHEQEKLKHHVYQQYLQTGSVF